MKIIIILSLAIVCNTVLAQYHMYVKKNDGATNIYEASDIEKIYFFNCGDVTVSYGGKVYNTIFIGDQCWLKENLDIGTFILKSTEQSDNGGSNYIEKYCYNDEESNCITYGGLYMWDEAMNYSTTEGTQGICPQGWRIPTLAELETLKSEVADDGNALKEVGQGSDAGAGTNTSGFSALLAGYVTYLGHGKVWGGLGTETQIWSSTLFSTYFPYNLFLAGYNSNISNSPNHKDYGSSIRCIFDLEAR